MAHGFSLLELSIVLVIVGLLAGGVMTGQALIHAAEIRSVFTAAEKAETAIYAFRDKYAALPGDMKTATAFWTSRGGTGADVTCYTAFPVGTSTCNGNGDAFIGYGIESFLAWQHLSNAGLVEGSFTGRGITTYSTGLEGGTNTPLLQLRVSVMLSSANASTSSDWFPTPPAHLIQMGYSTGGSAAILPWLAADDAYSYDRKYDDGLPALGNLRTYSHAANPVYYNNGGDCTTSADPAVATYATSLPGINCSLFLMLRR